MDARMNEKRCNLSDGGDVNNTFNESQSLANHENCNSITNEEVVKQIDHVQQWVNNTNNVVVDNVPPLLFGICKQFFQYAYSDCTTPNCPYIHTLSVEFHEKLLHFPHDQLKKALLICKMWTKLYMETIKTFVTAFTAFKDAKEIWTILTDVFALPIFDKSSIVESCMNAFKSFGLSFENIIDKILADFSDLNHFLVIDLILEYTLTQSSYTVVENWPTIKRLLTLMKSNKLDHGIFTTLVTQCMLVKHRKLAVFILIDIIEKDMVNLNFVDDKLYLNFQKFVHDECAHIVRNAKLHKTSIYLLNSGNSSSKYSVAGKILVKREDGTSSHYLNSKSLGSAETNEKNVVSPTLSNNDNISNNESDLSNCVKNERN